MDKYYLGHDGSLFRVDSEGKWNYFSCMGLGWQLCFNYEDEGFIPIWPEMANVIVQRGYIE